MAKQDVLNAINSTIVQNNIKAITAQSLNNVLTMMVENAGEGGGSGDGALKILVPDMIVGIMLVEEGDFSLEAISELREMLLEFTPEEAEMFEPYLVECENAIVHNANVFATIKEKADRGEGCMVLLDQSYLFKSYLDSINVPEFTEMYVSQSVAMSQVGNVSFAYIDVVSEYEEMFGGDMVALAIRPTKSADILDMEMVGYPTNMLLMLQPDGSIIFEHIEEEPKLVTFYIPSGETLTSDEKDKNKAAYDRWVANKDATIMIKTVDETAEAHIYPIASMFMDDVLQIYYVSPVIVNGQVSIPVISIMDDGTTTIG